MEQATNGKMNKKLLQKTLKYYLSYSIIVMLLAAPLFYFISQFLYIDDADEELLILKKEFVAFSIPELNTTDIVIWNTWNRDLKIEKNNAQIKKDTLFYRSYYNHLSKENEPYRVLHSPIIIENKPYIFSAKINLVEKEDLIISIVLLFAFVVIILLIGLFIITKKISIKLWKPFYDILRQIEQFEIDKNSNLKFEVSYIEEFNRLNFSIKKLIDKNILIYKCQREFIENAAHELQTPIAIFKGKIENILQRKDLNQEQFQLIDDLNITTSRLVKLNKNLLVLSKIESNSYPEKQQVTISEIINNQIAFFSEQAKSKDIEINVNNHQEVVVTVNPFLVEILLNNLFINTINHNVQGGQINVFISPKGILFSNTGVLLPLKTEKMFERFSKSNPSSNGNGLGLSIIKKIVDANNWSIEYSFKDKLHNFEVIF